MKNILILVSICLLFIPLITYAQSSTGEVISNEIGTLQIEFSHYEKPSGREFVKIFGTINEPMEGGKVVSIVTSPDGEDEGNHLFTSGIGDYEFFYELDNSSEFGTYSVFVSYVGQVIGTVNFEVVNEVTPSTKSEKSIPSVETAQSETNPILPNIFPKSLPSIQLENYGTNLPISAKKLSIGTTHNVIISEKNNQFFTLKMIDPFPGYGQGQIAIELVSANIKNDVFSDFKSLGFENLIGFALNSKTGKIYLYEFERQDIIVIDSSSLKIIDTIQVNFEEPYRQRDIAVNENTNKIYLLLEEMGRVGGTVHNLKYKIQVFDGNSKNLIKEIELNDPANKLVVDQKNNWIYADNWVGQKYFIIDNEEKLFTIPFSATAEQYVTSLLVNEKNNHLFIGLGNKHNHMQEILIVESFSGKQIKRITDVDVLKTSIPAIISEKHDVMIFSTGQGFAILNLHDEEYNLVKKINLPGIETGHPRSIDEENDRLFSGYIPGGVAVYSLSDLLTTSILGDPESESMISTNYRLCWDEIRKLDTENAQEAYHSSDGIGSYWTQSTTMYDDMIYECEEIKRIALEKAEIQETILQEERLGFPKTVDSRCDLVYLINRESEIRGGFGLAPEESVVGKIESITAEYQQRVSDEPWNAEEIGQELLDEIKETMVDSIMRKYSIDVSLRSAISQLITPIGTYDTDILRGIFLMKPEHYAEDIDCGKMLKTHYYDQMYQFNKAAYGQSTADKMEVAIDEAIKEEDKRKSNPVSVIEDTAKNIEKSSNRGGGCLIATAAYGTELAPQVQFLREIRDNTVMSTASGAYFMTGFNQLYYSFSPTIADMEREHPMFQEAVRAFITPMISTLSIMTLAENGSEVEVLGLGISVIALNLGMYIAAPAVVTWQIKKRI